METPVLNRSLDVAPWLDPVAWRLPGTFPLDPADWLRVSDAFAGQMALRDGLIAGRPADVHAMLPEAEEAAAECLEFVLGHCGQTQGYEKTESTVLRPDGMLVPVDRARPLLTIGRLVQEDVCILQRIVGDEHVLTGAILCFPASWTLSEKIGRPMTRIHRPVREYGDTVAPRVQRMFDRMRPETPLWRANALLYDHPRLHSPKAEASGERHLSDEGRFLRSERQTLRKLPRTGAIVFAIHTVLVEIADLTAEQRATLERVTRGRETP
ncbi:DUF3445 domain-containing protein [Alphaproteobacteria bacterium GH1-50]|uniref:DUF3445 domain-containing protein n=1 Tax=Kangsaoukella pontilimi TaxID=2691042 RepID=A0A7C9MKC3_9RHOB|nr:DUF3445 domain-containing protein [Kangsaoukella pontilimi]MXQ08395.1 DUF3445 domain-containing protein [Kangsaoukella pontilimi]